jgi:polar amino acid transport system substrate-binding protein
MVRKSELHRMGRGLLVSAFALFAIASLGAQEKPLTIVTEEWAPYNFTDNGTLTGFSVEIVQAIVKELKANYTVQVFPSMRASQMLNDGPRTMMITMLRTKEREGLYKWVGPLGDGAIYLYKKKGSALVVSTLEDAKKVQLIACRNAGLVTNTLKAAGFTNLDASATDGASIYKKLLLDRCDLGISDAPLGVKYQLKKLGYPADALTQTAVKVVESPMYIACSKDIPDSEIALWQKALDKVKASGDYEAIQKKYNN